MPDDIALFEIRKAVRTGVPPLIGLFGPSGSGKTYSALHIARGIVGAKGKIGLIDTENLRALTYANDAGGWDHIDLQPPFHPDRYVTAFQTFEHAGGYDCVIVDSMSHAWSGEGGVLDVAERNATPGLQKWKAPKVAYQRMVNSLLRAPYAVIFCLRVKDGVRQIGRGKEASIESTGLVPICGKGFIHEMTVAALIGADHCPVFPQSDSPLKCDPLIPSLKAPDALKSIFAPGQPLGIETGKKIAEWVSGGAAFDADTARLERVARDVATMGSEKLQAHWISLGGKGQRALAHIKDELKAIAAEADQQMAGTDDYDQADGVVL